MLMNAIETFGRKKILIRNEYFIFFFFESKLKFNYILTMQKHKNERQQITNRTPRVNWFSRCWTVKSSPICYRPIFHLLIRNVDELISIKKVWRRTGKTFNYHVQYCVNVLARARQPNVLFLSRSRNVFSFLLKWNRHRYDNFHFLKIYI